MRVFSLSTCDTCRKALKQIRESGIEPEIIDIRKDGIAERDLDRITREFGDDCVNVRSTTWRGLSELQKLEPPRELIEEFPTVMKRPVIDDNGAWHLGWGSDVQAAVLRTQR